MKKHSGTGAAGPVRKSNRLRSTVFTGVSAIFLALPLGAEAQSYRFNDVRIEGNARIEAGTILSYAGIPRGQTVSAADLSAGYQRIVQSGLFETVEIVPQGGTLVIQVTEFPTINRISFEGNARIKDEALDAIVNSRSRFVFSPSTAEADAARISEAYAQQGRLAARVTPRIIRRSDNRVDLVFEIFEGDNVEVERISFVGNRVFSDRRLRGVLQTKQAGLLRVLFQRDTFVADRIEFEKQTLRDFYLSRGYVDFRITGVNGELTRERDGYFLTFNVQEGQQFRLGQVTTTSEISEADAAEFQAALAVTPGQVYSPTLIENSIARMERLAIQKGIDFLRVEPRITRNERDLTLDVEFVLSRGERIFVERIDIEGNTTTLDRVIRRQFDTAEGDPFNPREIRETAERIRALGYFTNAQVNAREGSAPDQVIVDVNVEEQPTGSLSFGGAYSTNSGFGLVASFQENNFLGRGQQLSLDFSGAESAERYSLSFSEPAFLGRDVRFDFSIGYVETSSDHSVYDTETISFGTGLTFPITELSRLNLRYNIDATEITGVNDAGGIIQAEAARGQVITSSLGYRYSYDSRRVGLNPSAGVLAEFSQDFAGVGGDQSYVKSQARVVAQKLVFSEAVTLRATLQGGMINGLGDDSETRVTDRFRIGGSIMRGFEPGGIGPREVDAARDINDSLGGKMFAVAQLEAEFPLGLPEEYGISGGVFYDVGTLWGIDGKGNAIGSIVGDDPDLRHVVGVSLFWTTPIGPLRFNFSKALQKEDFDEEQTFDFTIRTEF